MMVERLDEGSMKNSARRQNLFHRLLDLSARDLALPRWLEN